MQRPFRKFAWLILATLATMSLAVGAVVAHEGRPVGDYRFIVGWLEEPAYEGFQNAVSLRVNMIIEAEEAAAMGAQQEEHGEPGHHGAGIESEKPMSVDVKTSADSVSGLNVQIITEGFTFAPDSVNGAHVEGEGHAHIYVDGEKITRVYTPWHYLGELEPGEHEIRVTLNANSHEEYLYNGSKVQATTVVALPEPHGHTHAAESVEAQGEMSVNIALESDPLGGANLFVETTGFAFAPQNVGDHHIPGEGHGHVYVNGVKIGRVYGKAMQLGNLAAGINEVQVTLNSNEHSGYAWNGEPVQSTATINIIEGSSGGSSMLPMPSGAAKPLASMSGQHEGVSVPVEGLEGDLQVEITHVASGTSRMFDLEAAWGDPGHYVAGVIPTASGVYEFRIFGTIEGTPVDETFVSAGGGGDFDDIRPSADLQFPEQLPELREVVGAAQGARDIAQQAQDTALAAQAGGDGDDSGNALTVVAMIIGIVGALLGAGGIFLAVQARRAA